MGDEKLPMIGAAISATELATTTTPYYYQVGPTNEREAQVAAFRAGQLGARTVTVYYSGDPNDIYSNDLKEQVKEAFERQQIAVSEKRYRVGLAGVDLTSASSDAMHAVFRKTVSLSMRDEQSNCPSP